MKSVLISVHPKWCKLIANGRKTVEVRRTRPKLGTPFKCYIYESKARSGVPASIVEDGHVSFEGRGQVIGEFVCDRIDAIVPTTEPYGIYDIDDDYVLQTCLENGALWDYGRGKMLYGWHVSNPKIYDTPRELREFTGLRETKFGAEPVPITRPPQSWC